MDFGQLESNYNYKYQLHLLSPPFVIEGKFPTYFRRLPYKVFFYGDSDKVQFEVTM